MSFLTRPFFDPTRFLVANIPIKEIGRFLALYLLLLPISWTLVWLFTSQIDLTNRDAQEHFVIDVYFYQFLGSEIAETYRRATGSTVVELIIAYAPNPSSIGITFLNAMYALAGTGAYTGAALQCLVFAVGACIAWPHRFLRKGLALLLLSGLLPYLLLPSKESFILVGYMMFFVGWFSEPRRGLLAFIGVVLMGLARPEFAILLLLTVLLSWRPGPIWSLVKVIAVPLTYLMFRDHLVSLSEVEQLVASGKPDFFCSVGPVGICLGGEPFEWVAVKRFLMTAGLPVKWILEWVQNIGSMTVTDLPIKTSQVMLVIWAISSFKLLTKDNLRQPANRFALIFLFVYSAVYSTVVFFQPSRQIALALCIFLFSISFPHQHEERRAS